MPNVQILNPQNLTLLIIKFNLLPLEIQRLPTPKKQFILMPIVWNEVVFRQTEDILVVLDCQTGYKGTTEDIWYFLVVKL